MVPAVTVWSLDRWSTGVRFAKEDPSQLSLSHCVRARSSTSNVRSLLEHMLSIMPNSKHKTVTYVEALISVNRQAVKLYLAKQTAKQMALERFQVHVFAHPLLHNDSGPI